MTAPLARDGPLSSDSATGTINVTLRVAGKDSTKPLATRLRQDVETAVTGTDIVVRPPDALAQVLDEDNNRCAEMVGPLAALVILLIAFGSITAALLPLGSAMVGLAVAILGLGLLGHAIDIPTAAPSLASVIGLGVGIDYSLVGSNRFQRALIDGQEPVPAATTTAATAGSDVLFAAFSVIAALSGFALVGIPLMRSLAIASGVAVLVACAASVTLLPACLGRGFGHRLATRRPESLGGAGGWTRLAEWEAPRPWPVLIGCIVVLGALAAPAVDLRLGPLDAGAAPSSTLSRQSYDQLSDGFGAGSNGPLLSTATFPTALLGAADTKALAPRAGIAGAAGASVGSPSQVSVDGLVPRLSAQPATAPSDPASRDLVDRLRVDALPAATSHVGGLTAGKGDLTDRISGRKGLVVATFVLVATLLPLIAFRAPIVAIKAALMNLPSVGAAGGILVAVFTWGWGDGLLGLQAPVPIESHVPLLMFAVLFALSTDYEVVPLTAIRAEWVVSSDGRRSVALAMAKTGRDVTSAALIMVCVFLSFTVATDPVIKVLGLGMAAAVAVDATIVRGRPVPSAMTLLGQWNWWLPPGSTGFFRTCTTLPRPPSSCRRDLRGPNGSAHGHVDEGRDCCALSTEGHLHYTEPPGWGSAGRRSIIGVSWRTALASARRSPSTRAWGPSQSAWSGCGWTSTMMPSAPMAMAARESGTTRSRRPPEWDGSTTIGRCERPWTTGTAEMSRVLRVAVSNVRIPRSHRTISRLPRWATYSAAISHSTIVELMPRLSITGLPASPTAWRSLKFWALRVPTWSMSA